MKVSTAKRHFLYHFPLPTAPYRILGGTSSSYHGVHGENILRHSVNRLLERVVINVFYYMFKSATLIALLYCTFLFITCLDQCSSISYSDPVKCRNPSHQWHWKYVSHDFPQVTSFWLTYFWTWSNVQLLPGSSLWHRWPTPGLGFGWMTSTVRGVMTPWRPTDRASWLTSSSHACSPNSCKVRWDGHAFKGCMRKHTWRGI